MALCIRLLSQAQLNGRIFSSLYPTTVRCVTLKAVPAQPPSSESYDEKNARLKRPQSPHLTIYKPQLTSLMSISHRMTGMALGVYMSALGLGALVSPVDMPALISDVANLHLPSAVIIGGKTILAFPLAYHLVNGVRHLAWDTGRFLTIKQVYMTGYITLALSALLTAWLVSL
ncbi:succinate dehydrogenase cytochrome b560 subunit, mitochondrial [Anabrus simplex]|uniref:succinate dehydrogenase cytochrome b560 subunit, mitochondrial n=1 Tax=Anabrus simplex TaxID=316456 RepID=UPI0034DD6D56